MDKITDYVNVPFLSQDKYIVLHLINGRMVSHDTSDLNKQLILNGTTLELYKDGILTETIVLNKDKSLDKFTRECQGSVIPKDWLVNYKRDDVSILDFVMNFNIFLKDVDLYSKLVYLVPLSNLENCFSTYDITKIVVKQVPLRYKEGTIPCDTLKEI